MDFHEFVLFSKKYNFQKDLEYARAFMKNELNPFCYFRFKGVFFEKPLCDYYTCSQSLITQHVPDFTVFQISRFGFVILIFARAQSEKIFSG